jgi:hypothetical protein
MLERELTLPEILSLRREPAVEAEGHWWLVFTTLLGRKVMSVDLADASSQPTLLVTPVTAMLPTDPRIALTADGNTLALADGEGVWLWDVSDKHNPQQLPGRLRSTEPGSQDGISDMAFSPSGQYLLVSVAQDFGARGELVIYEVATRTGVAGRSLPGPARRVAVSPDGRAVAASLTMCGTILYCRDEGG